MEVRRIIKIGEQDILFGQPSSQSELSEMFRLRYLVYVKEKGYIPLSSELERLGEDRDEHDEKDECHYFIAKLNNKIVGTARIIDTHPLPIEVDYFSFSPPSEFGNISQEKLIEIGRIISRPHLAGDVKVPRGIIPLGLFNVMNDFGDEGGYVGGYGAIKEYAFKKLKKLSFPLRPVKDYKLTYSPEGSNDPLKNFFDPQDPVMPTYFFNEEIRSFFDSFFKSRFFVSEGDNSYRMLKDELSFLDRVKIKLSTMF